MPITDLSSIVADRAADDADFSLFTSPGTATTDDIDNAPGDLTSANTLTPKVLARKTASAGRPKQFLIEVLDHTAAVIGSFTTANLTTSFVTYTGTAVDISAYTKANIDDFQLRHTPQEGGGMAAGTNWEIDWLYATLDYENVANINADLAATDGADTASMSTSVEVAATIAATDGADSASMSASVEIEGSIAATDGADTASMSASVDIEGSIVAIDGADVAAFVIEVVGGGGGGGGGGGTVSFSPRYVDHPDYMTCHYARN